MVVKSEETFWIRAKWLTKACYIKKKRLVKRLCNQSLK